VNYEHFNSKNIFRETAVFRTKILETAVRDTVTIGRVLATGLLDNCSKHIEILDNIKKKKKIFTKLRNRESGIWNYTVKSKVTIATFITIQNRIELNARIHENVLYILCFGIYIILRPSGKFYKTTWIYTVKHKIVTHLINSY